MALPVELYQRFSTYALLGAADASKTIRAGGAGIIIAVTRILVICQASAAQAVYVGDTSGTIKAILVAAAYPLHGNITFVSEVGLKLTEGEDLIIKPAAAGPSFHVTAEGYLLKSNVNLGA